MTTAAVPVQTCTATVHDSSTAYRKRGCTCPTARQAERERKAGYDRNRVSPRNLETKTNSMARFMLAGLPPFGFDRRSHCANLADPDIMHAESGPDLAAAKKICGKCPLKTECREWAIEHRQIWGVWGGLDSRERRREIVRRVKAEKQLADDLELHRDEVTWLISRRRSNQQIARALRITEDRVAAMRTALEAGA